MAAARFLGVEVESRVQLKEKEKLVRIDTVPELAQRKGKNLHLKKLKDVAEENKNFVRRVPSASDVEKWVAQGKELPRVINY